MSHRLIFVTGKGGVGRSTVSAALAIASAQSGNRTLLAETAGQDRIQRIFGRHGRRSEEVKLAARLFAVSIDPALAMEEYLRIRLGAFGRALGSTSLFQTLSTGTPGMREMQTMAKIWELAHPERPAGEGDAYDVVIVDAPPSGHAIGLLRTPGTYAEIARVGPVAKGARTIAEMVADPDFTGFVGVTTAEEMAVTETLLLQDALELEGLGLSSVAVNCLYPNRFTPDEIAELERCDLTPSEPTHSALRAAVLDHHRANRETAQVKRLADGVAAPLIGLPFLFVDEVDRGALHALANAFTGAEGGPLRSASLNSAD